MPGRRGLAIPRRLRPILRSPLRVIGFTLLFLFILLSLVAPLVAPADPTLGELTARLGHPLLFGGDSSHFLGTDSLGRDIVTRLLYGARVSLLVGLSSVAIAGSIG